MSEHLALDMPPRPVNSSAWKNSHSKSCHWRTVLLALGDPLPWRTYSEIGATVATIRPGGRLWLLTATPRGHAMYRGAYCAPYRAPRSLGFPQPLPLDEAQQFATDWLISAAGIEWISAAQLNAALKAQRISEQWGRGAPSKWALNWIAKRMRAIAPPETAGAAHAHIEAALCRRMAPRICRFLFPDNSQLQSGGAS